MSWRSSKSRKMIDFDDLLRILSFLGPPEIILFLASSRICLDMRTCFRLDFPDFSRLASFSCPDPVPDPRFELPEVVPGCFQRVVQVFKVVRSRILSYYNNIGVAQIPDFLYFWIDFDGFERSPDRWSQAPDSRVQRLPEVFQRCSSVDLGVQSGQKGTQ